MPQDIHPLPDSVEPYMVYNFTLEQHTIAHEQARRAALSAREGEHQQTLHQWELEKARRRKEALRRVAPGFEPERGTLVPTRVGVGVGGGGLDAVARAGGAQERPASGNVMDDLVDELERMEARGSRT